MGRDPKFKVGDSVYTTFYHGHITKHMIITCQTGVCQSGVMYRVDPPLPRCVADDWIDEGWFYANEEERA
jgi:hypothetical protein